jgi:UDPglucose 6-dehydrogenase
MKLSFVNALAELCDVLGADVADVTEGIGHDHRIGQAFLRPGPGWGGSCLPKDTQAMVHVAAAAGRELPLVSASIATNERQRGLIVDKVRAAAGGGLEGRRIGLTFKAGTDDLRNSPALDVAALLRAEGAELTAYDPGCPAPVPGVTDDVAVVDDALLAAKDVEVLVVLTEWPQFRALDWAAVADVMRNPVVVDARNHVDPAVLRRAGVGWVGVGRR